MPLQRAINPSLNLCLCCPDNQNKHILFWSWFFVVFSAIGRLPQHLSNALILAWQEVEIALLELLFCRTTYLTSKYRKKIAPVILKSIFNVSVKA